MPSHGRTPWDIDDAPRPTECVKETGSGLERWTTPRREWDVSGAGVAAVCVPAARPCAVSEYECGLARLAWPQWLRAGAARSYCICVTLYGRWIH